MTAKKPKKEPKPHGRPTKYEEWMDDKIVEIMTNGASKVEVAYELGITKETLHQWCNPDGDYYNQRFSDSIKRGEAASQVWWEREGRKGVWGGKQFNAAAFIFQVKNRFRDDYNVKDNQSDININTGPVGNKIVDGMDDERIG